MGVKSSSIMGVIDSMLKRDALKLLPLPSEAKKKGRKDDIGLSTSKQGLSNGT